FETFDQSAAGGAELGRDVRERGFQLAAERVDDRDDGDRDAGGNQAILDGGRTGLVLGELHKGLHAQLLDPRGCLSWARATVCFPADQDLRRTLYRRCCPPVNRCAETPKYRRTCLHG